MTVKTLDHVNIRTAKLRETCAFYAELLGLSATPAPGQADLAHAVWLRDPAQRPVVHVVALGQSYGDGQDGAPARHGSGAVHHVAFDCDDYEGMHARLIERGCALRTAEVPAASLRQIFIEDPNGILVELNFRAL